MKIPVIRSLSIFLLSLSLVGCPPATTTGDPDPQPKPDQVKVPFLVGQNITAAENSIRTAGLILGSRLRENSASVPLDHIVRQDPPGGTRVAPNTPIKLVLSLGAESTVVPSLANNTRLDAEAEISAAGLSIGSISEQFSRTVPPGHVIGQEPPPGTRVPMNNAVVLIISRGPAAIVPNIVGSSLSVATERLTSIGLKAGQVTIGYSDTIPVAQVMSQNPAAGQEAAPQSGVAMVVSGGIAPVTVPDVSGLTRSTAESRLGDAGLRVGATTEAHSATVPVGRVISQNPPANTSASPSSLVSLVLSLGPEPITVPDLVGKTPTIAERDLENLGLILGAITEEFSSTIAAGRVVTQSPLPGEQILPGGEVSLVLSKGVLLVNVPDVVGSTLSAAEATLLAGNLTLGTVSEQFSDTIEQGVIISQNPVADSSIGSGTPVAVVLSLGPQSSETTETVGSTESTVDLDDLSLTVPTNSLETSTTITVYRNRPGSFVDRGNNDQVVSQVYRVEHDAGTSLHSQSDPFQIHLAFDERAIDREEGETIDNTTVFVRVTTEEASFRLAGSLVNGGIQVSTGTLPEGASMQVLFNPSMRAVFSDSDGEKGLTRNAPWRTTRFRCTYDERSSSLIQAVSTVTDTPISELSEDTLRDALRDLVANNARDAAAYCEALGFREADLSVVPSSTGDYFDIHLDSYPNTSHFVAGSLAWNQLNVDTARLNPAAGDPLGTIRNGIGHDIAHAAFNGYNLNLSTDNDYAAGTHESIASLIGHSLAADRIAVHEAYVDTLGDTIGISDIICNPNGCTYSARAYHNQDWFAYLGKRFGGDSLNYLGGAGTDGNGLLEQFRIVNSAETPITQEETLAQLRTAMNNAFEAQFAQPLSEVYWDYARNRAFEHNDESRLRSSDGPVERFTLDTSLFEDAHIQTYQFQSDEQGFELDPDSTPLLKNIPPLTSRALVFEANGIAADMTLRFNRDEWVPDGSGSSMMVKVYKVGFNGVELASADDTIQLTGIGDLDDTLSNAVVVLLSNVSLDQHYDVSVEAVTSVATGGIGTLAGRVTNPLTEAPVANVAIAVRGRNFDDNDDVIATTMSDSNGQFLLQDLPSGYVEITYSREGHVSTLQTATVVSDVTAQIAATLLVATNASTVGNVTGQIIDNVTGHVLDNVVLTLRAGILRPRDRNYDVVGSASTNANGDYSFNDLPAGTYTAFATRFGYVDEAFVIYVVGGTTQSGQNGDMTTTVDAGTIRIVLTWGEQPYDLDSHLTGPSGTGRFHVFFANRQSNSVDLDLDDLFSYGPETTTIRRRVAGTYRFSVHDYTNLESNASMAMSNSGAKVRVITEFGTTEFNITPNTPATLWTVCEIDGLTGAITEVDDYSFTFAPNSSNKSRGWRYGLGSEVPNTINRDLVEK